MKNFDFKNPDYQSVFTERAARLAWIHSNPESIPGLIKHYSQDDNIPQFISDWGMTYDPRNMSKKKGGRPAYIPFILFKRQVEWVEEFLYCFNNEEPLVCPKTRDMGLSWLSIAVACSLCVLRGGITAGFGSRKEILVDRKGDPSCLFYKAKFFINNLPVFFRGGFVEKTHASSMKIEIPRMSSFITGEAGDGIGRGGRASFYIVDESAFLVRPHLTEASLSETTDCRVDISTVNGSANPFAQKIINKTCRIFEFDWRQDPRKDEKWYQSRVKRLDPVTLAQEINRDLNASKEGIIIPSAWVQAAIGAHKKLKIKPTGKGQGAFDVADDGKDKNAFCGRKGILLNHLESWHGRGAESDIAKSTAKCFRLCDQHGYDGFYYDGIGIGAGVKGDSRILNEKREKRNQKILDVNIFKGSNKVVDPTGRMIDGVKNEDHFKNHKAQGWWHLRMLFQNTYRVIEGLAEANEYDEDDFISIDNELPNLSSLCTELSQPTFSDKNGKIMIDKQPDGAASPNLADAVMMSYAPKKRKPQHFYG
jgi:hypothetical protein